MKKILTPIFLLCLYANISAQTTDVDNTNQSNQVKLEEKIPYQEVLLWLLGTLSTFLIWRIQYQKDRIKDIESQLSDRKYKLYSELVYLIMDLIISIKTEKPLTESDIKNRVLLVKRELFLYAPDNIFKAFLAWTLELQKPNSKVDHFKMYFKMIQLIRKDMGFRSSKIDLDDFMLFLLQDKDEYEKFKVLNKW